MFRCSFSTLTLEISHGHGPAPFGCSAWLAAATGGGSGLGVRPGHVGRWLEELSTAGCWAEAWDRRVVGGTVPQGGGSRHGVRGGSPDCPPGPQPLEHISSSRAERRPHFMLIPAEEVWGARGSAPLAGALCRQPADGAERGEARAALSRGASWDGANIPGPPRPLTAGARSP